MDILIYLSALLIKNAEANAIIEYNSGSTASIIVLPNTSLPEAISAIPLAQICPCLIAA
jgi:hypothetical protein